MGMQLSSHCPNIIYENESQSSGMLHYQEGELEASQSRLVQLQGHHANQVYYKSGIMSQNT